MRIHDMTEQAVISHQATRAGIRVALTPDDQRRIYVTARAQLRAGNSLAGIIAGIYTETARRAHCQTRD